MGGKRTLRREAGTVKFPATSGGLAMRGFTVFFCAALLFGCGKPQPDQNSPPKQTIQFQHATADEVVHGARIADVLGCTGCHGANLEGEDWSDPGFGKLWTANLTHAASRYDDEAFADVIRSGARSDRDLWEMPSHLFTQLAPADMAALIKFIRSKPPSGIDHPPPVFEEGARREMAAGTFKSSAAQVKEEGQQWPPVAPDQYALGRYIARSTCAECHGMTLIGGQPNPEATVRPDLSVVVTAYDDATFARLLRSGKAVGNREVGLMSKVARSRYQHLTDAEVQAVYDYLRAISDK